MLGAYLQHQLARIYLLVGEYDKALDQLEPLLGIPYYLSPAWLRVDPTFDPLGVTRVSSGCSEALDKPGTSAALLTAAGFGARRCSGWSASGRQPGPGSGRSLALVVARTEPRLTHAEVRGMER